ncbi:hypothetical protein GCM10011344_20670 [Dokdonia pacifica]|uniref:replication protein n=1 Tax=Dokdonia pacifica TaxID=1627892 RepID=UPI000B76C230|nr:replication protein [Dokdonia pacifica]GGG19906.1 hypothetical protein GCM10011344_20670 [Dokdonia pacifica]
MAYQYKTSVPNIVFEKHLDIQGSMLKVLLVIIRQTYGYYDPKTRKHKEWDWIAISVFCKKTKLKRRTIGIAIQRLIDAQLILVKNEHGKFAHTPMDRKFSNKLYFKVTLK